jgi:hypothetical protein
MPLICPACKTNNTKEGARSCVQCGSDLHVHRLLQRINKDIEMNDETINPVPKEKTSTFSIVSKTAPSIILLLCAVFVIFVGMRFLTFLESETSRRVFVADKWSQAGFEQLQQMNLTVKQQLDLILEQHRENGVMQTKVLELTDIVQKNKIEALNLILDQYRENSAMQTKVLELTDRTQKNKIQELNNIIENNNKAREVTGETSELPNSFQGDDSEV